MERQKGQGQRSRRLVRAQGLEQRAGAVMLSPLAPGPHLFLLEQQQAAATQQEEPLLEAASQQAGRLLTTPQQPHARTLTPDTWVQTSGEGGKAWEAGLEDAGSGKEAHL